MGQVFLHWKDATFNAFPDSLEVAFAGPRTIHEIDVFSVQDNAIMPELPPDPPPPVIPPVEPTEQMTFTQFGIQDFDLEYWTGSAWQLVPGGAILNNNKVWRKVTFPPLTTTKIRVMVKRGMAGFSRIVELEAWG